jgi:hypothetical protein
MSSDNSYGDHNSDTFQDNTIKLSNSESDESNNESSSINESSDYSTDYQDNKQRYVHDKIIKHYPDTIHSLNPETIPSTYKNCVLRAFHKNKTTNLIEGYIDKHGIYHKLLNPIKDKDVLIKIEDPLNKLNDIKLNDIKSKRIDDITQKKLEYYINSKYIQPKNKDITILYNHHDNSFIPVSKKLQRKQMIHVLLLIKYYKVQHTTLYKISKRKTVKTIKLPSKIKLPFASKKSPIRKESSSESLQPSEEPSEPSEEVTVEPSEEPSDLPLVEEVTVEPSEEPEPEPEPIKEEEPVKEELPVVKQIMIKKKYKILKDKNGKVIGRLV